MSVRTVVLSAVICAATACTSGDGTREETSSSPTMSPTAAPSASPVASPPAKPRKPSLARLEGTYVVKFTLVRTNVSGAHPNSVQTYVF